VNYNWNWHIFREPAPNGTGTYLDMLLSGLVLTIETRDLRLDHCAGHRIDHRCAPHAAVEDRILGQLLLRRILPQHAAARAAVPVVLRAARTTATVRGTLDEADVQRAVLYRGDRGRAVHVRARRRATGGRCRFAAARPESRPPPALGLTTSQTYRYVLLPMAYRIVLPPLTSEFLSTIKNTSVAITIGLIELTGQARAMQELFVSGVRGVHRCDGVVPPDQYRGRHRQRFVERAVAIPGYISGK